LLTIFLYAFTSYSGLTIALQKGTAAHKYRIFENWRIAWRIFYVEMVSIILERPWAVVQSVWRETTNEK